jgi:cytosine/adenosine deaminase-related metal-dependent hydrolase
MTDLIVRDGYLETRDVVVDIAVDDGAIREIAPDIDRDAETELSARGNLVSPGLVDAHVHLDMALSACGGRRPRDNDAAFDMDRALERTAAYFADSSPTAIRSNVQNAVETAVANGVVHVRTHAYVDGHVGADVVECLVDARERVDHLLDLQVVAFPQQGIRRDEGSEAAMRTALAAGADAAGGLDPATVNGDRRATIATWFDVATDHDVDLDVHVHERGASGLETLERLAAQTVANGYEGRVTASHAYALADASRREANDTGDRLSTVMEAFRAAEMDVITCYQSTPVGMPIRELREAGLDISHGTDQVHDIWGAHGNLDALEAMLVESLRLDGYASNEGLRTLWDLITARGASVLGIEGYEPAVGTPADLVVHSAASPEWAILTNETPAYVITDGTVVAEDGTLAR